jgi:catechol 1,2-dioxygenase
MNFQLIKLNLLAPVSGLLTILRETIHKSFIMERRKFVKDAGMIAISIGVLGKISRAKDRFVGDTPTTTDILGPFYRPGAPIRNDINVKEYAGKIFHISGTVSREDGKTPFENCLVEVWQCDENGLYDNTSDEFNYRGAQRTGADGKYHFTSTHPIPYLVEGTSVYRPAHIHLLVSGAGQQDLITQVYFEGDPHLKQDIGSMSAHASKRILKISRNSKNEESVHFDIVMAKEFKPDSAVFEKLCGLYKMSDNSTIEFYRKDDLLFTKWNGQIWAGLTYRGNNTFVNGADDLNKVIFEILSNGEVKVKVSFRTVVKGSIDMTGSRKFSYK